MRAPDDSIEPLEGLATDAYRQLRDLIVLGRLGPGAPLVETDLAARLGISRTPVRAALQRLQQERFVVWSRVGNLTRSVVTPLTADDMSEVFTIVGALEAVAGERAAALDDGARQTLVDTMRQLNRGLAEAAQTKPPDVAGARSLHVQFHHSYVRAAAGPRLKAELDALQPHAERYEHVYTTALIGEFNPSLVEHDVITDAIAAGDATAAGRSIAANWRNGADRYRRVVAMLGEKGTW